MRKYKSRIRFPRFGKLNRQVQIYEKVLWHTYNSLIHRRNFMMRRHFIYDVYKAKRTMANAKTKFLILAEQLIQRGIKPQFYLQVMSNYGTQHTRNMHHPSFLASNKAFEVFEWLAAKERSKYPDEGSFKNSLVQGTARTFDEILHSVKQGAEYGNALSPLHLFVQRDSISNWYLALRSDFAGSQYHSMCEHGRKKQMGYCKLRLEDNPRIWKQARQLVKIPRFPRSR
jgi:hypothetical protein